jgi:hypothetical protein
MCTVSFLPQTRGFFLAMNRDEQKSRARAMPPRRRQTGAHASLYPSEKSGGTWIGVNDAGMALALINWYAKPQRDRSLCLSRGIVIPELLAAGDLKDLSAGLKNLPLSELNPFRLVAISIGERSVREWRWDGKSLTSKRFSWTRHHWFSSGYDEALVERRRRPLVRAIAETPSAIRRLHRSHKPERGPFSICMHRDVAETVSYTEIAVTKEKARLRYAAGAPCTKTMGVSRVLSRTREIKL